MRKLVILCLVLIFAAPGFATVGSTDIPYSYWTDYVLSDKCPSDKPFLTEEVANRYHDNPGQILNYKCVSCFEFEEDFVRIPEGHEKDFEICDNRDIVYSYRTLYSVKKCPSDFPLRIAWDAFREAWYGCESCQAVQWLEVKEADCRLCGDWRTMKKLDGWLYCVLNKSPDPDRPLVENDDKLLYHAHNTRLFSCTEAKDIHTTKENCDLCPNREYIDGQCILKEPK